MFFSKPAISNAKSGATGLTSAVHTPLIVTRAFLPTLSAPAEAHSLKQVYSNREGMVLAMRTICVG
jgi:hypothetical protein